MRVIQSILLILFLALVILSSCNDNRIATGALEYKQGASTDTLIHLEGRPIDQITAERLKERIMGNIASIRMKVQTLDQCLNDSIVISTQAHQTSEQLRADLVRLEQDLENRLKILENKVHGTDVSTEAEVSRDLEKIEDELSQIKVEIDDWVDVNIE